MAKRILIVDDEERILFVLSSVLSKVENSLEITTASNGEEAVEKTRAAPFDLVITDLIMPGMDGVELTREIRTLRPAAAVIWMTAYGSQRFVAEAQELAVHRCLDKPLEIEEFREAVRQALELGE
jgi:two-component system response regulator (stage 0 sporulation protein F)